MQALLLAVAACLAGCGEKKANTVAVRNDWRDRCQVGIRETYAADSQFLDLRPGTAGSFANLAKGTYTIAFNPFCGAEPCGTAYGGSVTVAFDGCCGSRSFVVDANGAVRE